MTERLLGYQVGLVVISGGEPLSQQSRLLPVLRALRDQGVAVEFETNGTLEPSPAVVETGARFNVSPKLAHSGVEERRRIVPDALRSLAAVPGSAFKFVCEDLADLDEVADLTERMGITNIWIMPQARSPEEVVDCVRLLADEVAARRWNLSGRLHVTVWGNRRGM